MDLLSSVSSSSNSKNVSNNIVGVSLYSKEVLDNNVSEDKKSKEYVSDSLSKLKVSMLEVFARLDKSLKDCSTISESFATDTNNKKKDPTKIPPNFPNNIS